MNADAAYMMQDRSTVARLLHRAGRWDEALAVLPTDAVAERAEVSVDRCFWRLDGVAAAEDAVSALRATDPNLARFLEARVRYTRLLFDLDPRPDDLQQAREGFDAATTDVRLAGWGAFWLGVLTDILDGDPRTAASAYRRALEHAVGQRDALLESYAVRHIGGQVLDEDRDQGIVLLRRSYHLRAALGARPQTAAAAVTLAGELGADNEADQLLEAAGLAAQELGLTWLLRTL